MARKGREDELGVWHHVVHRGLARRTAFKTCPNMRMFMALAARAVHAGQRELHAFARLATHFHLLERSNAGDIGEAMRRIQNGDVRWFNRGRRRAGPAAQRWTSAPHPSAG